MEKVKAKKGKLVAIFLSAFFLSSPTWSTEAFAFRFTAPSAAVVQISCDYLANAFVK